MTPPTPRARGTRITPTNAASTAPTHNVIRVPSARTPYATTTPPTVAALLSQWLPIYEPLQGSSTPRTPSSTHHSTRFPHLSLLHTRNTAKRHHSNTKQSNNAPQLPHKPPRPQLPHKQVRPQLQHKPLRPSCSNSSKSAVCQRHTYAGNPRLRSGSDGRGHTVTPPTPRARGTRITPTNKSQRLQPTMRGQSRWF